MINRFVSGVFDDIETRAISMLQNDRHHCSFRRVTPRFTREKLLTCSCKGRNVEMLVLHYCASVI
jgi:hypothetical protein